MDVLGVYLDPDSDDEDLCEASTSGRGVFSSPHQVFIVQKLSKALAGFRPSVVCEGFLAELCPPYATGCAFKPLGRDQSLSFKYEPPSPKFSHSSERAGCVSYRLQLLHGSQFLYSLRGLPKALRCQRAARALEWGPVHLVFAASSDLDTFLGTLKYVEVQEEGRQEEEQRQHLGGGQGQGQHSSSPATTAPAGYSLGRPAPPPPLTLPATDVVGNSSCGGDGGAHGHSHSHSHHHQHGRSHHHHHHHHHHHQQQQHGHHHHHHHHHYHGGHQHQHQQHQQHGAMAVDVPPSSLLMNTPPSSPAGPATPDAAAPVPPRTAGTRSAKSAASAGMPHSSAPASIPSSSTSTSTSTSTSAAGLASPLAPPPPASKHHRHHHLASPHGHPSIASTQTTVNPVRANAAAAATTRSSPAAPAPAPPTSSKAPAVPAVPTTPAGGSRSLAPMHSGAAASVAAARGGFLEVPGAPLRSAAGGVGGGSQAPSTRGVSGRVTVPAASVTKRMA